MSEIRIGRHGAIALVDAADVDLVRQYTWGLIVDGRTQYATTKKRIGDKRVHVKMHRLILGAQAGQMCDHINGNGLDNRRENLRLCTNAQNQAAAFHKARGSSRYRGVSWDKINKRWKAAIKYEGHCHSLGIHRTEELAAAAYDRAAAEHFGEFARLNVPPSGTAMSRTASHGACRATLEEHRARNKPLDTPSPPRGFILSVQPPRAAPGEQVTAVPSPATTTALERETLCRPSS